MKTLISIVSLWVGMFIAVPATANAFDWNVPWEKDDQATIERDKKGGYSETQRDYKSRKRRSEKSKQGAGYENGTYKSKSGKYKKHEWQFIDEEK